MLSDTQLTKIRAEIAKVREGEAKLVAIVLDVIAERDAAQARVRELEAELVAVKADNENLLHERLHATEASHELAATCDALRAAMRSALGNLAHGRTWAPHSTEYVTDAMTYLRAALDAAAVGDAAGEEGE